MCMSADTYFLQFRPVPSGTGVQQNCPELEITAVRSGVAGALKEHLQERWKHGLEKACSCMSLTAFECKAMDRTLRMGLPAYVIDRTTGEKQPFSREQVSVLWLTLNGYSRERPAEQALAS